MLNWRTILQMEWAMTYRGYLFKFNEVIIVLCAELNLTSNYGFIKDKIFLFKMRGFFPSTLRFLIGRLVVQKHMYFVRTSMY